jgi:predicted ATPase
VHDNHNPYASALDGLVLDDPVAAFFAFCREREQVRIRRESGAPGPWSEDPIFQQGRFLNVFREDDRGSKALLRFARPVAGDLPSLVHAVFFARWCNKQATLDALAPAQLLEPETLRKTLNALPSQPWCNVAAYPVGPVCWQGTLHSRLDTATTLLGGIKGELSRIIVDAGGDVVRATRAINAMFEMDNDFPIFMAVMDLAWFRPDVIDPGSHVPTGIGAVAFLDRLQGHLGLDSHVQTCDRMIALQGEYWPEARRRFQPIDIEYLSCECRKYYSYINGTKHFEGKNVFRPGASAQLDFDIADSGVAEIRTETQICVVAGGPCSGKTTLLKALDQAGYRVEVETSERLLEAGIAEGRTAEQMRSDPVSWQQEILRQDYALFDGLPIDEVVFTDTSFIENLVFSDRAGIAIGPKLESWLRNKRYKMVFFLDSLEAYEQSAVRLESEQVALQISEAVRQRYQQYGYQPVSVPAVSVAERVAFILAHLES